MCSCMYVCVRACARSGGSVGLYACMCVCAHGVKKAWRMFVATPPFRRGEGRGGEERVRAQMGKGVRAGPWFEAGG